LPVSGFSALEWQVVAIAQHDRLSSLEKPGRLAVALGVIFGGEVSNPKLADQKLEALRRVSVLAWHKAMPCRATRSAPSTKRASRPSNMKRCSPPSAAAGQP
uniref:hypothetical protein n=1 Tax=Pseudomonas granadensis TaxID=1421430 RepID=UPI00300F64A7